MDISKIDKNFKVETKLNKRESTGGNARGTNKRRVDGNKKSGEINTLLN